MLWLLAQGEVTAADGSFIATVFAGASVGNALRAGAESALPTPADVRRLIVRGGFPGVPILCGAQRRPQADHAEPLSGAARDGLSGAAPARLGAQPGQAPR